MANVNLMILLVARKTQDYVALHTKQGRKAICVGVGFFLGEGGGIGIVNDHLVSSGCHLNDIED